MLSSVPKCCKMTLPTTVGLFGIRHMVLAHFIINRSVGDVVCISPAAFNFSEFFLLEHILGCVNLEAEVNLLFSSLRCEINL